MGGWVPVDKLDEAALLSDGDFDGRDLAVLRERLPQVFLAGVGVEPSDEHLNQDRLIL